MAEISAKLVKELREKTGAGMMDCKKALTQNEGDLTKSVEWLRQKGITSAEKKAGRVAAEGLVSSYIHTGGRIGVLVEVNCETDFVSRSEEFQTFANEIAMHIVASNPQYVSRDNVSLTDIERERSVMVDSLKDKPNSVVEKIVEGKLAKFYKEVCLLEQPFVRDNNLTITDLLGDLASKVGENIIIKRFVRFSVGE
jgi:elongation factor Ts